MRFYAMGVEETRNLELRTFWMISNQISRLQAAEDLRQLEVGAASQGGEGFKKAHAALKKSVGEVFVKKTADKGPGGTDKERLKALKASLQR